MTAATGQRIIRKRINHYRLDFKNVPFNNIDAIKNATTKDTCGGDAGADTGGGGCQHPR